MPLNASARLRERVAQISRLLHTLRHLKPVQIYGRVWRALYRPRVSPPRVEWAFPSAEHWLLPPAVERRYLGEGRFRLLNHEGRVRAADDWNDPAQSRLWLFNLHYFDDLRADDAASRREEQRDWMLRWIRDNPVGKGEGWHPYPTSLRIVNWTKWLLGDAEPPAEVLGSLALQAESTRLRQETHLLGNHLLANAKALMFAGLCFDGSAAQRWRRTGTRLLESQLPEQILLDGGHVERSPMYHALVLEDLLDLLNLARARPREFSQTWPGGVALLGSTASRMLRWCLAMAHPDGEIAFFNDAATGVALQPGRLLAYARDLGLGVDPPEPVHALQPSGYIRAAHGPAVLFADVAPIGPDHLPGHAHADTLSFELSIRDQRVLVNSGTSRYGTGSGRQQERSTAAHNTVQIDGRSSSDVWAGFRVGRRARAIGLTLRSDAQGCVISCAHDGYRYLPGRPVHRRTWRMSSSGLEVHDQVEGDFGSALGALHLAPRIGIDLAGDGRRAVLKPPDGGRVQLEVEGAHARLEDSLYHPQFGLSIPNQVLRISIEGRESLVRLRWG